MVEQNDGKFRRLEKIIKKNRFWSKSKFFSETSLLYVYIRMRKLKKKFVMATLNLKKSKKNNFAGGPFRQFGLKLSARPTITNF